MSKMRFHLRARALLAVAGVVVRVAGTTSAQAADGWKAKWDKVVAAAEKAVEFG